MTSVLLPEPLTPVTAMNSPSGNDDVHVLQVVVRGADDLDGAARRRPPRPRLDDAALAAQVGAGQRRLDAGALPSISFSGRPWKISLPPCSPARGPRSIR